MIADTHLVLICLFVHVIDIINNRRHTCTSICLFLAVIHLPGFLFIFTCNSSLCLSLPVIHFVDGHRHVPGLLRTRVGIVVILRN